MLRISNALMSQTGINAIIEQQAQVLKTQTQLAAQKRVLSPEDDPIAAARIVEFKQALKAVDQFNLNADTAERRLATSETSLRSASEVVQRVREITILSDNGTISDNERDIYATELRELRQAIFNLANTKDANGEFLFSGFQSSVQPFVMDGAGQVTYNGDEGQRFLSISDGRQIAVTDTGREIFSRVDTITSADGVNNTGTGTVRSVSIDDGESYNNQSYTITFTAEDQFNITDSNTGLMLAENQTYVNGGDPVVFNGLRLEIAGLPNVNDSFQVMPGPKTDIFSAMSTLISDLENGTDAAGGPSRLSQRINNTFAAIDQTLQNLSTTTSSVGSRLNAIDSQRAVNESVELELEQGLSMNQDLDFNEAIARFRQQMVALQAAQQSYASLQNLLLFNHL